MTATFVFPVAYKYVYKNILNTLYMCGGILESNIERVTVKDALFTVCA